MSVTLDTGALIVALQETCVLLDETAVARHANHRNLLLPHLDTLQSPFIVPAVVLAEFLFGIPDEYKHYAISLGSKFRISPLTPRVAIVASELRMQLLDGKEQKAVCETYGQDKKSFLADIYVLATSKCDGAMELVTRDRALSKKAIRLDIPCTHIEDIKPPVPIAVKPSPAETKPSTPGIFDSLDATIGDVAKGLLRNNLYNFDLGRMR